METYCHRCDRAVYVARGETLACPGCSSPLAAKLGVVDETV